MATTEPPIVVGLFRDTALAQQAITELQQNGFRNEQISTVGQTTHSGGFLNSIMSSFSGQEAAQSTNENLRSDLMTKDIPPNEAAYYQNEVQAGRTMVIVEAHGHSQEASAILHRFGAYDASNSTQANSGDQVIPLRQEILQIQKQWVDTGEVIIRKEVITEEKTFTVPVTREELVIERRPAGSNQPVSQLQNAGESVDEVLPNGGTLRIVLHEDQVRIEKYPVVKEEILISKRVLQETQHVSETVKHEEASLEQVGDVIVHGNGAAELAPEAPPVP